MAEENRLAVVSHMSTCLPALLSDLLWGNIIKYGIVLKASPAIILDHANAVLQ